MSESPNRRSGVDAGRASASLGKSTKVRSDSTFTIEARIDHLSDGVGCFDPLQVMSRMREAFPELVESTRDYLWETCDHLRKRSQAGAEVALRIAVRDMQEESRRFCLRFLYRMDD